jgi:methanogenic corrinoid protein MtbC1
LSTNLLETIEKSFAQVAPLEQVKSYVERALSERVSPVEIMQSMSHGLAMAGRKYEQGEFFLSELIMSGIMAQEVSNMLKPHLPSSKNQFFGKVVIATVKGDIHDLGKNLVSMMLSSAGFEVVDLGVDVPSQRLVDAVEREAPEIAAMSCLLTSAMDEMKNTMSGLEATGIRSRVKVLVGGRPITPDFAKEIGADGYGADAIEAVNAAKRTLKREDAWE